MSCRCRPLSSNVRPQNDAHFISYASECTSAPRTLINRSLYILIPMELVLTVFLLLLFQGLIFGFFCSYVAREKNRNSAAWFWLGFFFSFIALIALAAVPAIAATASYLGTNDYATKTTSNTNPRIGTCPSCEYEAELSFVHCPKCGPRNGFNELSRLRKG